jgi:glycosyltransferase involved in cell wall biosynthesis
MKKILYLTAGKVGLHSFTHTELCLLEQQQIPFILCLTQLNSGPFMPKAHWPLIKPKYGKIPAMIQKALFISPLEFIRLKLEAWQDRKMTAFFVAMNIFSQLTPTDIGSIHVQMADQKLIIGYFLSKLLKIPLTCTLHAHELYSRDIYDHLDRTRKYLLHCHKIMTISKFNLQELSGRLQIPAEKIRVMYLYPSNSGIDQPIYQKKILIAANWVKKKGFAALLNALAKMNRSDLLLWIAGGPVKTEEAIDVRQLVKELKLENHVVFLGFQPQPIMNILFEYCDVFCLPSITDFYADGNIREREGIPVALMDAMSWGKPVVSTIHAGIPELVKDFLVPENDVAALAAALEKALATQETKAKKERIKKTNQDIIRSTFHQDNVQHLIQVFKSIQGEREAT